MRIDLPIPRSKPFDVVGVGINVIDYLFRIPHFPEPDTKMDALSAMIQAARWAKADGIPVSVDAEEPTEHRDELFALTDILIVGQRYGRMLTGRHETQDILEGLARLGPACVGLTLAGAGSALRYRDEIVQAAGFAVNVVDTTGAGDVFHGAFLYGFLQGWEAGDILRFANAVSALKCTCLGGRTGIPRFEEARRFLAACG